MEVDVLPSTNVTIIKCLDSHFARYGVLVGLATYIGSKFVSEVKKTYLVKMAIIYTTTIYTIVAKSQWWSGAWELFTDRGTGN